jgi:Family of unknown function (DUF5670)
MQIGISAQPMVALIAEGLGLSIQKEADPAVDHFCHSLNFVLRGFISGYTMDGVIHILLVITIVVVLVRVIQGRPT